MSTEPLALPEAWRTLRRTRRPLPHRLKAGQTLHSGYVPAEAAKLLAADGQGAAAAEQLINGLVLQRFPAFADSWDSYVDNAGWLADALSLPAAERQAFAERWSIPGLLEIADQVPGNPLAALGDWPRLSGLLRETSALQLKRESGVHPAGTLMASRYGLHPELAKAVLLHGRIEPWWVHPVLSFFVLLCAGLFTLALADPHNAAFDNESVGGVGPLHYIVLPLFGLLIATVQVWLLKTRPQRQRQWREQLKRYAESRELPGGPPAAADASS